MSAIFAISITISDKISRVRRHNFPLNRTRCNDGENIPRALAIRGTGRDCFEKFSIHEIRDKGSKHDAAGCGNRQGDIGQTALLRLTA